MIINSYILVLIILINIAGWLVFRYISKRKESKAQEQQKKYINSLLALSISHLHDASNFFGLLKGQSDNKSIDNFVKGANYHFRSLFDELKNSQSIFENSSIEKIAEEHLEILYRREAIDLKDLLDLELFQLSNLNRLNISDKSDSEHALIYGNFTLISKILLNLLENALKYTEEKINIELNNKAAYWEIKLSSFGKEIPRDIVTQIKCQDTSNTGHGLSSLVDIMQFHNAKLEIDTLAGEGSCIRLIFEKYSSYETASQKEIISKKTIPIHNLNSKLTLVSSFILVLLSLGLITSHNKSICQNFHINKTEYLNNLEPSSQRYQLEAKAKLCKIKLEELKATLQNSDTQNFTIQGYNQNFIQEFENQGYISLILFNYLSTISPSAYDGQLALNAKSIIANKLNSMQIFYFLATKEFEKQNFLGGLNYSARGLVSLLKSKLYTNPIQYSVSKIYKEHNNIDELSKILASHYKKAPILEQKIIKPKVQKLAKKSKTISKPQKPKEESKTFLLDMIDAQDKSLGINFDL